MAMNRWVIHTATGEFRFGGFYEPTTPDSDHSIVTVPGETHPNPRTQRWNGSAVVAKTPQEIAAYDSALKDTKALSIDNDLLIQAIAQLDFEERQKLQVKNGQTLRTAAQCKARVKEIYRSLLDQ